MVDILHRVGIRASVGEVYAALTTREGIAGWWTSGARGDGALGGQLELPFAADEPYLMAVVTALPDEHVRWRVVRGPREWVGTYIDFRLQQAGDQAIVLFRHEGWASPVEFMHHCSTKWAMYLFSLRELVETGTGRPAPGDTKIDDWD